MWQCMVVMDERLGWRPKSVADGKCTLGCHRHCLINCQTWWTRPVAKRRQQLVWPHPTHRLEIYLWWAMQVVPNSKSSFINARLYHSNSSHILKVLRVYDVLSRFVLCVCLFRYGPFVLRTMLHYMFSYIKLLLLQLICVCVWIAWVTDRMKLMQGECQLDNIYIHM